LVSIEKLLEKVQKPARYVGGEVNQIVKDPAEVAVRFAFCFPDTYEVGMSHLGMKVLYHALNARDDTYCERVFAPWVDMEAEMRAAGVPLYSMETRTPVGEFDIVGFTLQYELSYSNILNMLSLASIPLLAAERGEKDPMIIAGGPCAFNPEPLCDFIDLIMLGDGEENAGQLCALLAEAKERGLSREELLLRAAKEIPGAYVPRFYDASYGEDGYFFGIRPNVEGIPETVVKALVQDLNAADFPDDIIVPNTEIVHDRIMLEIARGCTRGCRFCQAGMLYRPQRERGVCELLDLSQKLVAKTGYEEMSLSSLSTGDYSHLTELATELIKQHGDQKVALSLPSLRVDSVVKDALEQTAGMKKSGLTFAPEAGTQRLRDVINKGINAEQLTAQTHDAFSGGWSGVKLYFMIGLPTETDEDLQGIAELTRAVLDSYYAIPKDQRSPKGVRVSASASSFVPKAHTPFQWCAQDSMTELQRKQQMLRGLLRMRNATYNYHEAKVSFLEAAFARGDRRLSKVLLAAHKKGCRFDGWSEHFRFDAWMDAFAGCGLTAEQFANKEYSLDDPLPWDHLSCGVSKEFLAEEYRRAMRGEITPDCKQGCLGCGVGDLTGGVCPCA